jgi:hypothetical protein
MVQNINTTSTQTVDASNTMAGDIASINLKNINSKVNVKVEADVISSKVENTTKPEIVYTHELSLEEDMDDDASLIKHERPHYVQAFKVGMEKTARATLETCRVVYEANRVLDRYEFNNFCREVGFKDSSSTIRKFIAIGKVYPKFIKYADHLPHCWTNIYLLTQIPADEFEHLLERGSKLKDIKGKQLTLLLERTKDVGDLQSNLNYDKNQAGYVFGKAIFTRRVDDIDIRAMQKALNEIQARLPIKFVLSSQLELAILKRKEQRYDQSKKHFKGLEFTPEAWDLGEEANSVQSRLEEVETIE